MKSESEIIEQIKDALWDAQSLCVDAAMGHNDNMQFARLLGYSNGIFAALSALETGNPGMIRESVDRLLKEGNK